MLLFNHLPTPMLNWFLSASLLSIYPLCIKDGMPEILPLFLTYSLFLDSSGHFGFNNPQPQQPFPSVL